MEHLKEKLLGTKDQSLWPLFRYGREFENFQPWRDWNPFEINELWLPRTYLGFPFQQHFFLFNCCPLFVFHTNSADSSHRIFHLTFISSVRSSYSHPDLLLIHPPTTPPTFSDHTSPQYWTFTF